METLVLDAEVVSSENTKEKKQDAADKFFEVTLKSDQIGNMLEVVKNTQVMKAEDVKFLAEHKEHLQSVVTKTHIWRTDGQKRSIVSDTYHPTTHGKFQQAILEQKVFFTEATRLAKDFEKLKVATRKLLLDKEEKELEIQELVDKINTMSNCESNTFEMVSNGDGSWTTVNTKSTKNEKLKNEIKLRRLEADLDEIEIELKGKQLELHDCKVAMDYRMREIKGWQQIQTELMEMLKAEGYSEEEMFDKEAGEIEYQFFWGLNNFQGITVTKDGAEKVNLIALARHGVDQAIAKGKWEQFFKRCNQEQLWALEQLGYIARKKEAKQPEQT